MVSNLISSLQIHINNLGEKITSLQIFSDNSTPCYYINRKAEFFNLVLIVKKILNKIEELKMQAKVSHILTYWELSSRKQMLSVAWN
jgi:hypothetical protein